MVIFHLFHFFRENQNRMIHIEKGVFNNFQVNTYIIHDETGECLIVDPACDGDQEQDALANLIKLKGLTPKAQLFTHCHVDHILGMKFVAERFGIPAMGHNDEEKLLKNAPIMGELLGFNVESPPPLDKHLDHGDKVTFGNSAIKVRHVPGHSKGSLAFYAEKGVFVITGDALFAGGIGRTDLPGGDYDELVESINNQLFTLPDKTEIYPGHGPASTIGQEKESNPFFQ